MVYIVRYGELGLKGRNRGKFEKLLIGNIARALDRKSFDYDIKSYRGRVLIYTDNDAKFVLEKVPGIVSFSPAEEMSYEEVFSYILSKLKTMTPSTFRVSAHRVDKSFPKTSPKINEEIGSFIVQNFGWKVSLKNPELIVGVEIINSKAFVFFSTYRGVGGLPVGSAGKLVLLISSGLDSPVAGYLMLRRGAKIHALYLSQGPLGEKKVRKYITILSQYAPEDIPLEIHSHHSVLAEYARVLENRGMKRWTCVLCKYMMLHFAEQVAEREGALGIITGDSLGQVASQTLNNMYASSIGLKMPVYRPLIGMDKVEIESLARKIGTYEVFISAKEEKCPFRPKYVSVETNVERFREILKNLDL